MRVLKALVITLLIYALLIWFLLTQYAKIEKPSAPKKNHVIKIDIRNIPLPVKPAPLPIVASKVVQKPTVKKEVLKKVVKKEAVKKKKIVKKKVVKKKLIKKKEAVKEKIIVKEKPSKKKVYVSKKEEEPKKKEHKKVKSKKEVQKKSKALEAFEREMVYIDEPMIKPKKVQSPTPVSPWSYPNNKIRKLYGKQFHNFTATQKQFIENNLDKIQEITQRTLTRRGYPQGAGETGQEGTNVVSFKLHPNGDISNLRLKTRIGYRALDDNTLSLIRVAYMDYPYPTTTTKIVFYVTYSIYGY